MILLPVQPRSSLVPVKTIKEEEEKNHKGGRATGDKGKEKEVVKGNPFYFKKKKKHPHKPTDLFVGFLVGVF